jgi:enterochelin esterase-like enzyme
MSEGQLLPEQTFYSRSLGSKRTIRIYLPPAYNRKPRKRFPVLYLQDGQNMFSSAGPDACFGWGSWQIDRAMERLAETKSAQEIIMVAVDNSRYRYQEYRGPTASSQPTRFHDYANFLANELKPQIDREFRTLPKPANTGVLGSSLGGICSLAVAWDNPKTFGLAASLSGAFQVEKRCFLKRVLGGWKGRRKPLRLYLDSGVTDFDGDDDGFRDTAQVVEQLRRIGWKENVNLKYFVDPRPYTQDELAAAGVPEYKWSDAEESQHNEFYWGQRVWRALAFLFPADK